MKPGPADTAVIPELPLLKTRYDGGTMQSSGLKQVVATTTLALKGEEAVCDVVSGPVSVAF